jgi:hypothetical protein
MATWYISPRFGILCHEKSGNPEKAKTGLQSINTSGLKSVAFDRNEKKQVFSLTA